MKFTKIAAAIFAFVILLASCTSGETVITVGDTQITDNDIAFFTDFYYNQDKETGANPKYENLRDQVVDMYEEAALINAVAKIKGVTIDEEGQTAAINEMATFRMGFGGKKEFDKAIKKAGANEELLKYYFSSNALAQAFSEDEDIKVKEASDEELKAYVKENYWRAKHVLITVGEDVVTGDFEKSEAEKILKRAQDGEDFDKLVEEFSQDPGSKTNPDGYLFTEGQMVPEFEEGTKSIKPGEFTLVKTDYGYHVIQRLPLDESEAKFNELFEANKDSIKSFYNTYKFNQNLKAFAEANGVVITRYEDVINKMTEPKTTKYPEVKK